jgi:hypothetical protein
MFTHADVVHKEKRLRAAGKDVINTMIDQVDTYGIVPVEGTSDLQLGAHTIGAGDKNWLLILPQLKKTSEPANVT